MSSRDEEDKNNGVGVVEVRTSTIGHGVRVVEVRARLRVRDDGTRSTATND